MFNALLNAFNAFFDSLFYVLKEAWRQIGLLMGTAWGWAMACTGVVVWGVDLANSAISSLINQIDTLVFVTWPTIPAHASLSSLYALGNTIFPMAEALSFLIMYGFCIAILSIYKLFKTWIPTLS